MADIDNQDNNDSIKNQLKTLDLKNPSTAILAK